MLSTERLQVIYIYRQYLSLNNLQWLICHKTQTNQTNSIHCGWACIYVSIFIILSVAKMILHSQPISAVGVQVSLNPSILNVKIHDRQDLFAWRNSVFQLHISLN